MIIQPKDRLVIFTFYDEEGIADRYVIRLLEGLRTVAGRILVMVNGFLTDASRAAIGTVTSEIHFRSNVGLDVYACKQAFETVGWEILRSYKEVVCCNATVFGPVYPFSEMFDAMAKKDDLDFWGITVHPTHKTEEEYGAINPYGYLPEHIQSYFIVYRQQFTRAPELQAYWDGMPAISQYKEAVGLYETVFTKRFSDLGFKWDAYIRYDAEKDYTKYILMYEPLRAVKDFRSPVIKRKTFFLPEGLTLANSMGERAQELLDYLRETGLYDTDLIYENIIRRAYQPDFTDAMGFRFTVSEKGREESASAHKSPPRTALLALTDGSQSVEKNVSMLARFLPEKEKCTSFDRTGKTVADFLQTLRYVASGAEYVCVLNGVKDPDRLFETAEKSNLEAQTRSLLASPEAVQNILDLFDKQKYLGLLVPMPPMTIAHGYCWSDRWEGTFHQVKALKDTLGYAAPLEKERHPAAAYLSCFWVRSSAILPALTDEKTAALLASQSEVVLRHFLPFAVQKAGYASGYVTTDRLAGRQLAALTFYAEDASLNLERLREKTKEQNR